MIYFITGAVYAAMLILLFACLKAGSDADDWSEATQDALHHNAERLGLPINEGNVEPLYEGRLDAAHAHSNIARNRHNHV